MQTNKTNYPNQHQQQNNPPVISLHKKQKEALGFMKKNKTALVIALALLISGAVIFAQNTVFTKKVTIPSGTTISGNLDNTISSATNNVGDIISASINSPVVIDGKISIPAGSKLIGRISNLEHANSANATPGSISLTFDKVQTLDGNQVPINGTIQPIRGGISSRTIAVTTGRTGKQKFVTGVKDTAIGAGAGALLGTAIGAIAGHMPGRGAWSGAAIGGGLGAGKGIYDAVRDKGTTTYVNKPVAEDVVLGSGSSVFVTLNQPVQVIAQK